MRTTPDGTRRPATTIATSVAAITALFGLGACTNTPAASSASSSSVNSPASSAATSPTASPGPSSSATVSVGPSDPIALALLARTKAAALASGVVIITQAVGTGATQGGAMTLTKTGVHALLKSTALSLELLIVGPTAYYRAPAATLQAIGISATEAAAVGTKWVSYPITDPRVASFRGLDFTTLVSGQLVARGSVTLGASTVIRGIKVTTLKDSVVGILYVASVGSPLPVRQVSPNGAIVEFTNWGDNISVTAPSPAQVVDGTKLGK